jgi:signal peptidase I
LTSNPIPKGIVKDIIIVAVGVLLIWVSLQIVFGTQNPFYVVSSGSMVPELQVYDVLVVQGNKPFDEIKTGDVIVFNRPSGHDRVIVHRVVSILDDDPLTIRTRGDANPASIPGTDFPITNEEYIGEVAYVIPQVGYITRILTPPVNYIIIAIIIGVMIFKQVVKKKNEKKIVISESIDSENNDDLELETSEKEKNYDSDDGDNNELNKNSHDDAYVSAHDKMPDPNEKSNNKTDENFTDANKSQTADSSEKKPDEN